MILTPGLGWAGMQDIIVLDLTGIKRFTCVCRLPCPGLVETSQYNYGLTPQKCIVEWEVCVSTLQSPLSSPTFPVFVYWTLQGVRLSPHLPPRYLPKPFIHLSLQNVRLVTSPELARGLTAPWKTQYCLQQHVEHPARVYLDLLKVFVLF